MSKRTSRTSLKAHNTTLKQKLYQYKKREREIQRQEYLIYLTKETRAYKFFMRMNRLFKFNREIV